MMRALVLVVIAAVMGASPRDAEACTCRAPGEPCEELFRSTVFLGEAIKTTPPKQGTAVTTFKVIELLHAPGLAGATTVDVSHHTDGNTCGISFAIGKKYVVYGTGTAQAFSVGRCSGSHVYRPSDPDVRLARSKVTRTAARVEGTVRLLDGYDPKPHRGAVVQVAGTTLSATTDARGKFKLDVPPGSYKLEIASPGLRMQSGDAVTIDLPVAAACAHPVLDVVWDGRITGRVIGATGQPVAGIDVYAIETSARSAYRLTARTGADGSYTMHGVPAGTYRVAVSPDGGPTPLSPYPTTYAPGVASAGQAALVRVKRAEPTSGIDIRLPAATRVHTITVRVRGKDGTPIEHAQVNVAPKGANRSTGGSTDATGTFVARELDGVDAKVTACVLEPKYVCVDRHQTLTKDITIELALESP